MRIRWEIAARDVTRLHAFASQFTDHPLMADRRRRNLAARKPSLTRDAVWKAMVGCLLTTQQPSGPGRPVHRFLAQDPNPLNYRECVGRKSLAAYSRKALTRFGGIRFTTKIGSQIETNLSVLEDRLWPTVLADLDSLRRRIDQEEERRVANVIASHLIGFGPKQSRNFLQWLGLTRFEIPVDSRVMKWLNAFGFPLRLNPSVLSDPGSYELVLDGIQALCAAADIYPCLLDAAIFASFDSDVRAEDWANVDPT